jgi:hypothetical protein
LISSRGVKWCWKSTIMDFFLWLAESCIGCHHPRKRMIQ